LFASRPVEETALATYTSGRKGLLEGISDSLATLYRRRWLAVYFAQREIYRTYRTSYLGFLWALLAPLLMIVLLTLVFSEIIGIKFREVTGDSSLNFGLFLYCGLLPFLAFSEAMTKATNSIRANTALVQRVVFPLEVLPLTRAMTVQIDKIVGLGVLIIVVAVVESRLNLTILLLPVLLILQMIFITGLCYFFAVVGTYLPDVREALRSFVRAMFFITPVIWPPERLPEDLRWVTDYNPLAFLVEGYRDLVLEGTVPSASSTLWFALFAVLFCLAGFALFVRTKQNFADVL
jgi:ABC-type polysaccharide/polyol phosphate export permease